MKIMTDQDRWENMSEEERDGAKHGLFGTYWSEIERQARADSEEE